MIDERMRRRGIEKPNKKRAGKVFRERGPVLINNKYLYQRYLSSEQVAKRAIRRAGRSIPLGPEEE